MQIAFAGNFIQCHLVQRERALVQRAFRRQLEVLLRDRRWFGRFNYSLRGRAGDRLRFRRSGRGGDGGVSRFSRARIRRRFGGDGGVVLVDRENSGRRQDDQRDRRSRQRRARPALPSQSFIGLGLAVEDRRFNRRNLVFFIEITSRFVLRFVHLEERRLFFQAFVHAARAARIIATADRSRRAHFFFAGQADVDIPFVGGVGHGNRVNQQLHVGMLRRVDHIDRRASLRRRALIQHINLIADLISRAQIMRDIKERNIMVVAQAQHGIKDRGAQGGVDHGHRFVGYDQARLDHIGPGHHDALALAAAELMRVFAQDILAIQTDHVQAGFHHVAVFALIVGKAEVRVDQIKDMVDAVKGIVNAEGILKDRLHIAPVDLQLGIAHVGDVFAIKDDVARCQLDEAEDQIRQRCFAAAALARDRRDGRWRFVDGQIEVVQGDNRFSSAEEAAAGIDFARVTNLQ